MDQGRSSGIGEGIQKRSEGHTARSAQPLRPSTRVDNSNCFGETVHRFDEPYIRENFGVIWPKHVETLTWFLIQCRKHFAGDLDLFLVLAAIGDRSFAAKRVPRDLNYQSLVDGTGPPIEPESLNIQSLSDFSGIPRETVRRKIKDLTDRGWVDRDEDGFLRATRKAFLDLQPLTETSFKYLARMAAVFEKAP